MENEYIDQLRKVLTKQTLHDQLNQVRKDLLLMWVEQSAGDPDVAAFQGGTIHPQENWKINRVFRTWQSDYESVLRDQVLRELTPPYILDIEDLNEAVLDHLIVTDQEYDDAFKRFGRSIVTKVMMFQSSQAIPVATLLGRPDDFEEELIVWFNRSLGISLSDIGPAEIVSGADEMRLLGEDVVLYARVKGFASRRAVADLQEEAKLLMQSLIRSCVVLDAVEQPPEYYPFVTPNYCMGLPGLQKWELLEDFLPSLMELMKVYYSAPTKEQKFHRRMRNAIRLLMEADQQQSNAVGLALCFASMEAMICDNNTSVVSTLSENAAVLLEHEPRGRADAVKYVAKLYDLRSKVLHGAEVDHSSESRFNARTLAAGILMAMLERDQFLSKIGASFEPADFFAELKDARLSGRLVLELLNPRCESC